MKDEEQRAAVILQWDPAIDAADIAVTVKSGVVTLAGFVLSYHDKYEAETATKRLTGVHGVANDIEVRLHSLAEKCDPEIARDAVAAIKSQLPGHWENIKIITEAAWVTLEGEVDWHYQRDIAEKAVRGLRGVKGVINSIMLESKVVSQEIKGRIIAAFHRGAQVDANRITVETRGGEVTLKGAVRSWAERDEAQRAAWAAPGVTHIDNQITVV